MKYRFFVNCSAILLAFVLLSGSDSSSINKHDVLHKRSISEKYAHLTTTLHNHLSEKIKEEFIPSLAIVTIKEGVVLHKAIYQHPKIMTHHTPLDTNTLYRIGSLSKGFAGTLCAILSEKGLLDMDELVSVYLPDVQFKNSKIKNELTVKHLISHTTGFTKHAFSNLVDENISRDRISKSLSQLAPRDPIGKVYNYQNATLVWLEMIIEEVTKMSFDMALSHYIFEPLEMQRTACRYETVRMDTNKVYGYKYIDHNSLLAQDIKPHYYNVIAAGGITSSLNDMEKWLMAIMGYMPEVISQNALQKAFYPFIETTQDKKNFHKWPGFNSSYYGLGWRILSIGEKVWYYHGGMVNGFRAEIMYDPIDHLGTVCMINAVHPYANQVVKEVFDLMSVTLDEEVRI